MNVRHLIVPGLLAAVLLTACGDDAPPPAPPAAPATQQQQKPQEQVAAADAGTTGPAPVAYQYVPVGKRDPFRSPIEDATKTQQAESCGDAGPLGEWGLDQLTLVGTVTSDANPIGMVEDPNGKGYIVRRNTPVGSLCGKVTDVNRDCITVTEYYPTPDGKRVPNPKKICLASDASKAGDVDLSTGKKVQ